MYVFDIYETCFDIKCCRTCRMKTVNVDKICRYSHQNHDNMYTSSIHVYSLQKHKTAVTFNKLTLLQIAWWF